MSCSWFDLGSEFFWLFAAGMFLGLALGSGLLGLLSRFEAPKRNGRRAPRRKQRSRFVQFTLFLSAAVGLSGLSLTRISPFLLDWRREHLLFVLTILAFFLGFRLFFRYLVVPTLILVTAYFILVAGTIRGWSCGLDEEKPLSFKTLVTEDGEYQLDFRSGTNGGTVTGLEDQSDGLSLVLPVELVRFADWAFVPACRVCLRVGGGEGLNLFGRWSQGIGLLDRRFEEVTLEQPRVLRQYSLYYDLEQMKLILKTE